MLAWCFLGSTMRQAEANHATENTLESLKQRWRLPGRGVGEGKLVGSFTHLLLSPRMSGLPAVKPLPISKPKSG